MSKVVAKTLRHAMLLRDRKNRFSDCGRYTGVFQ